MTDTNNGIISKKSIQGKFTRKFFKRREEQLLNLIDSNLSSEEREELSPKILNRQYEYPMGTVCTIPFKRYWVDKKALFVAISKMNIDGIAESNLENFQMALPQLWEYIGKKCDLGKITIPILGSGYSRIDATRQDLLKEIVQSFLIATTNKKFCNHLTIVIYHKDIKNHSIDIDYIKDFIKYNCKYFENRPQRGEPKGVGIK